MLRLRKRPARCSAESYIGLTGTPIEKMDANARAVFGDHTYSVDSRFSGYLGVKQSTISKSETGRWHDVAEAQSEEYVQYTNNQFRWQEAHMKILNRAGEAILSMEQWTRPKKEHHWAESRSAMELARAWCPASGPACPAAISQLLSSHAWTRDLQLEEVRPEHVTPLPERGEGRNHDLWARGSADGRAFTLCVEARADEPFGDTIGETCAKAVERSEAPVLNRTSRSWWQRS